MKVTVSGKTRVLKSKPFTKKLRSGRSMSGRGSSSVGIIGVSSSLGVVGLSESVSSVLSAGMLVVEAELVSMLMKSKSVMSLAVVFSMISKYSSVAVTLTRVWLAKSKVPCSMVSSLKARLLSSPMRSVPSVKSLITLA